MNFSQNESGAVTVDWVVLTAALVGLGLATMSVVSTGVQDVSGDVATQLGGQTILTSFAADVAPALQFTSSPSELSGYQPVACSGSAYDSAQSISAQGCAIGYYIVSQAFVLEDGSEYIVEAVMNVNGSAATLSTDGNYQYLYANGNADDLNMGEFGVSDYTGAYRVRYQPDGGSPVYIDSATAPQELLDDAALNAPLYDVTEQWAGGL